jgi:hypothetical protein
MFKENKYLNYYNNIITKAKSRTLLPETYTEKHHIIPKSLGGSNSKENLVVLTTREHFICHILLTKFTLGDARRKMIFALMGMKRNRNGKRYINSRLYDTVRLASSIEFKNLNKGRKHSEETRAKVSAASANRIHSAETKEKISIANKGKKKSPQHIEKMKLLRHTDEAKARMSLAQKGKKMSIETKAKMSLASKGKKKSKEHASNISAGLKGKLKGPMSEEQKLKRSTKLKGKVSPNLGNAGKYNHSNEAKQKIIESNKRRVVSDETKAKIAAGVKLAQEKRRQLVLS